MKKSHDRINELSKQLTQYNLGGVGGAVQWHDFQNLMNGTIDPSKHGWQFFKSNLDANGVEEDRAHAYATEAVKVMNTTWAMRQEREKLNSQLSGLVQNMNPEQARVLQEQGIDPNYLVQQMNVTPGTFTANWDPTNPTQNIGDINAFTAYGGLNFTGEQGQSFQDVMGQYIQTPQDLTREQTMTDEQRRQLRALQQLASVSGGRFESKE